MHFNKFITIVSIMLTGLFAVQAKDIIVKTNLVYDIKGKDTLMFDYYSVNNFQKQKACLVYVHGGSFKGGKKDGKQEQQFCQAMADSNLSVISISYRLGLKNRKASNFNQKPLEKAINMAVEDLASALQYFIYEHTNLHIDTNKIILMGSSAGAITVLHTDYELARGNYAHKIDTSFNIAGVISCAGAIYSTRGLPKYPGEPLPTLFFHGTNDKVVPYKTRKFLGKGFYGPAKLTKVFDKNNWPCQIVVFDGAAHEVAMKPLRENMIGIRQFVNENL